MSKSHKTDENASNENNQKTFTIDSISYKKYDPKTKSYVTRTKKNIQVMIDENNKFKMCNVCQPQRTYEPMSFAQNENMSHLNQANFERNKVALSEEMQKYDMLIRQHNSLVKILKNLNEELRETEKEFYKVEKEFKETPNEKKHEMEGTKRIEEDIEHLKEGIEENENNIEKIKFEMMKTSKKIDDFYKMMNIK